MGLRDVTKSVKAGLNIEEPFHQQRYTKLRAALDRGDVTWDDIRELGERILDTQLRFYAQRDMREPAGTMAGAEHAALAREVAEQSMVLLKNDVRALPLDPAAVSRITVAGRLADTANTGDQGSSNVRAPYTVTPLEGCARHSATMRWITRKDATP